MKVMLLTTHLEMGGIPVYVTGLAEGLKRLGHTPVVVSDSGALESRLSEQGVAYQHVPCRTSSELNPKLWFRILPRLLRIVSREKPDILHAHTRTMQVLAWAVHMLSGVPFVTTCHGLYQYRIGRRLFRCWGRWVIAISKASMQRLVEQYKLAPPHQVILIWNGVEVDRFLQAPSPEEVDHFRQVNGLKTGPVIGAVCRLSPVKGLDLLLRSVPGLLKQFPALQVLLVGDGPAREDLICLAYALGIAEHVVISHPVRDTRVPMAAMSIFAAPAHREGFGLSIVEAMVAGLPVVATAAGGPEDIIENGRTGLLIQPGNVEALEQALLKLLQDEALRNRLAQEGRKEAVQHFDMKRVVQQVEQVYKRALNGCG